jgi:hypothetical protein
VLGEPEPGNITVFPNPAQTHFNLSWQMPTSGNVQIMITDYFNRNMLVKQQYAGAGLQKLAVNAANWKEGMYVVRITHPGGVMVQRMLVAK